jgi:pimeloyl-ACP methyl ester carboxylesterase
VRSWLAVAFFVILGVTAWAYARLPGNRDSGIFDTDLPTPYSHYTPTGTFLGRVLVVHGLNANRNVMNILCYALADAGFEAFAIDLPGHGESRAGFNGVRAFDVVRQVLDRLGPDTIVLGHSLGGALLLDIANDRHIGRMVLFSPAPTPLGPIHADQILVLESQFDPTGIRTFAPYIKDAASGTFEYRELPWTGHSGGLFRPWAIEGVVDWLGGRTGQGHTTRRLLLIALMLLSGVAAGIQVLRMLRATPPLKPPDRSIQVHILHYAAAAWIAVAILSIVNVTAWLRLFVTDYLIGFCFLAGLLLFVRYRPPVRSSVRHVLIALGAAVFLVAVTISPASELAHLTISGARWWRFLAIALLSFPLFLVDETVLRPVRSKKTAAGVAVVTRLVLAATVVSGALILNRSAAFLLLLIHMVTVFWILLWLGTGVVRKRTDPVAAALFSAVVQAWIFSALFVTT